MISRRGMTEMYDWMYDWIFERMTGYVCRMDNISFNFNAQRSAAYQGLAPRPQHQHRRTCTCHQDLTLCGHHRCLLALGAHVPTENSKFLFGRVDGQHFNFNFNTRSTVLNKNLESHCRGTFALLHKWSAALRIENNDWINDWKNLK